MALFMTPEQVAAEEAQARQGVGNQYESAVAGGLFNLGHVAGDAFQRGAFDTDTRSKAVKDAQFITKTVAQADFNKPETIVSVANQLNKAGHTDQAFKFLSAVPPSVKPPEVWSEPYEVELKGADGRIKRMRKQKNQYGQERNLGEAGETADTSGGGDLKFPSSIYDQVRIKDTQIANFDAKLRSDPAFRSAIWGMDTYDEQDLLPAVADIESVANQLKAERRNELIGRVVSGEIPPEAVQPMLEADGGDDHWQRQAFQIWQAGGGWEAVLDKSYFGGEEVQYRGDKDTADLPALRKEIEKNRKMAEATANVAARTDQLVYGGPGEFSLKRLDSVQAQQVFGNMVGKDEAKIRDDLIQMGYKFNSDLYRTHAQRWTLMKDNPQATAIALTYADSPNLGAARKAEYLADLEESEDVNQFASAVEIFKYMNRLTLDEQAQKVEWGSADRKSIKDGGVLPYERGN